MHLMKYRMRGWLSILAIASMIGIGIALGWSRCAQTTDHAAQAELALLHVEVANLQATAVQREAAIHKEETLKIDQQTVPSAAVTLASKDSSQRSGTKSPSSTLDWFQALKVATVARLMVKGASQSAVMPSGSMEPVFNQRAILVLEAAKFDDLKVGDIVTYRHPSYGLLVVHRIIEKRGNRFWAKGDSNDHMDTAYITRENFVARVYCIVYASESATQASHPPPSRAAE
jgi:signal peptidase I